MKNICQKTNFDFIDNPDVEILQVGVKFPDQELETLVDYYEVTNTLLTGSTSEEHPIPIEKIGYCCEPRGKDYPICVKLDNNSANYRKFYLGKTGMLEFMTEEFYDINKEEPQEETLLPQVVGVLLPRGIPGDTPIKFVFDYSYATN